MIHVNVALSNPSEWQGSPGTTEDVRVMVDTGATFSLFSASLLERLRIQRMGQRRFHGFGGSLVRYVGSVSIAYDGETTPALVVFGHEDEPSVLGVTALETLGFQVDPVNDELHRVDLLI